MPTRIKIGSSLSLKFALVSLLLERGIGFHVEDPYESMNESSNKVLSRKNADGRRILARIALSWGVQIRKDEDLETSACDDKELFGGSRSLGCLLAYENVDWFWN
jgi:hypothetical protein